MLLIAGASPAGLNGEQRVTSVTATQFTFAATESDQTATGTITSKIAPIGGWQKAFSGTNKAAYQITTDIGATAAQQIYYLAMFYLGSNSQFTDARDAYTPDELWLLEHPPVFTLGRNGKDEHVHDPGNIPVIRADRGGQVTYHGPGQVIAYCLLDLRRRRLGVQSLVETLEQAVIDLLAEHGITGARRNKAPGVYVEDRKIAALGLRIRRGCSFHGLALNVDMDLAPFARINPCGFKNLEITDLARLGADSELDVVRDKLLPHLLQHLRMNQALSSLSLSGVPTSLQNPE